MQNYMVDWKMECISYLSISAKASVGAMVDMCKRTIYYLCWYIHRCVVSVIRMMIWSLDSCWSRFWSTYSPDPNTFCSSVNNYYRINLVLNKEIFMWMWKVCMYQSMSYHYFVMYVCIEIICYKYNSWLNHLMKFCFYDFETMVFILGMC